MRHVVLITTGGTIEKTYDETTGDLNNRRSIVGRMLRRLRLDDVSVSINELMSKDSLLLTDDDRKRIVATVRIAAGGAPAPSGVVVLHGTDTLSLTGETLLAELDPVPLPVVLTGAMRPFEMKHSDALQNLTEAIFATGVLAPGVYCVAHGKALAFPGVVKDRVRRTFTKA
ncbi:MAG: asparaginase [Phycisphaeraceae bacterium]|nr:asparaginase [Phycisphaeraceae bacterium]MBX3408762.1 asparaginase [Phycisphaeraceae bacterium]